MNKKFIFPIAIEFLAIFAIGYFIVRKESSQQKNFYDNYPLLEHKTMYEGLIVEKRYMHGRTFFEFKNGTKHSIPWAYNYDHDNYFIGDLLAIGDSIIKPANSDTLFIYKGKMKYYFVLEKRINK